ncbi:cellulosome anchor protein [Halorubrum sp. BOL3-1]|uniref:cellulosome anchor protein n=1 Tax=Halorubrum sp. BOL3-1 TaxID=2497325 RepID=UPI0010052308|nr:cellulosome anchor protein [Halorubrum sp. BOL3-1]QAU11787.1 cellulosome anchor protein [Halorubrum sp. BOL3-1]
MRPNRRRGRTALAVLVGVALLVGATGALAVPASAGDTAGALSVSPEAFDVEPGDTVTFEVSMVNDGERDDDGVYGFTLRLDYPSEYLTVTEVESADWFREAPAGDDDTSQSDVEVRESVDYDDEHGAARLVQSLADPTTGVTGTAPVATVTVRVEPDAEPAVAELRTNGTSTALTSRRDFPQPLMTPSASFNISGGGGEVVAPDYDDAAFSDGEAGETTASENGTASDPSGNDTDAGADDGADETGSGGDTDGGEGSGTRDEAPAPLGAVVVGVVAAALLLGRR